ncbi:MAG TPA: GDP-mannose 4,6-dehydratase, partial [Anaerolineales bacterium]|nr:GDP-mannose 4,6-dehydratase [Anaerolineales bacterium]
RWGYAASKMVDEFLGLAYYHEKKLPVVVFRLFNTVGPRQSARYGMVIPRFVEQALKGEKIPVFGDGKQSRCFMHVRDAVEAIIRLSDHPEAVGKVFNIGATTEISIYDLAAKVLTMTHETADPAVDPATNIELIPYEQAYAAGFEDMRRRVPDTSKIKALTGWEATRSLDEILKDVIAEKMSR